LSNNTNDDGRMFVYSSLHSTKCSRTSYIFSEKQTRQCRFAVFTTIRAIVIPLDRPIVACPAYSKMRKCTTFPRAVRRRTLETVVHKMEENANDLHELQSQVSLKHSAMMTEREVAADARDSTLKCTYCCYCLPADFRILHAGSGWFGAAKPVAEVGGRRLVGQPPSPPPIGSEFFQ